MTPKIQQLAAGKGISNAFQLKQKLKCSTSTAYKLWDWTIDSLHLKTIKALCRVLDCTADELLDIKPLHRKGR